MRSRPFTSPFSFGRSFLSFSYFFTILLSKTFSAAAARRVNELAEQTPAPSRAPVGPDAEKMLQLVREKSDPELDALRLQLVGLS